MFRATGGRTLREVPRHLGAILALLLAPFGQAAVVEVNVPVMPLAGANVIVAAPSAAAAPAGGTLLLPVSTLKPEGLLPRARVLAGRVASALGLKASPLANRDADVALNLLFDGSIEEAPGLWLPAEPLASGLREPELPALPPSLARELQSVSRLPEARRELVVRELLATEVRVRGPPAFDEDHTFSLEIEFLVNRQLKTTRPLAPLDWADARHEVARRTLEAAPAGWRLKPDALGASNTLEYNTGGPNGKFHVNTAAEWESLLAGISRLDAALPGGVYGLHLHNGLASRATREGLAVDGDRFARLIKVYEGYWRALAGLGYAEPRQPAVGKQNQIDYVPFEALVPGNGDLHMRDHGVAINLHPRFPTIETRIMSGILEREPTGRERIDVSRLAADVWWNFALARAAAGDDDFELATLGVPITAGMRPSMKQILHFADRVYGADTTGKALAIQKLLERYDREEGLNDSAADVADGEARAFYRSQGLGVVYDLHAAADGVDERLLEHLRRPGVLSTLARDLSLANRDVNDSLSFFPASFRPILGRAIEEKRASEPWWRRALAAVKSVF